MDSQIIDAKCPYCKAVFKTSAFGSSWAQCLWGEYPSSSTEHKCEVCGETSVVSIKRVHKYSAKKLKR